MEWCKGRASRRSPFFMVSEKFRFANFPGICYDAEKGVLEKGGLPVPVDRKNVIADTFANMVQRSGLDKITVKALIEECHISRQTFYYHFQDLMDVLEYSIRQATQDLVEQSVQAETMGEALGIFVGFTVEHFPMLQKLLDSQRRAQIETIMLEGVMAYLRAMARHSTAGRLAVSYGEQEVLLRYNAYGLVGILLAYGGRKDLDQEKLVALLERILSGEMTQWLSS